VITADRVIEFYCHMLAASPTSVGDRRACVEGCVGNALAAAMYLRDVEEPDEVDPLQVAAYTMWYLLRGHCFHDGNKRIAWLAAIDILWNEASVSVDASDDEAEEMVLDAAQGLLTADGVSQWLAARLVPAPTTTPRVPISVK
jgi:death-on-curing protein